MLSNNGTVCCQKSYKLETVVKQRHSLLSEVLQTRQCCQTTAQSAVRSPTNWRLLSNNSTVCCQKSYKQDNVVKQRHSLLAEVLQTGHCCQTTAQSAVRSPTNRTLLSNNGTVCCLKSYKQDNVVKQQHSLLSEVLQTGQCCQTTAQSAV